MLTPWYDPDCDYIFVYDEPCETLHEIFDLDIGKTVLHTVKQTGRINNINLIQYARSTRPKGNKWKAYSDDCLHQVKKLFN